VIRWAQRITAAKRPQATREPAARRQRTGELPALRPQPAERWR
jgi:hypothetical protein